MKRLTEKQAARAATWLENTLNLEDWDVRLFLSEETPPWVGDNREGILRGCTDIAYQDKSALVWVHPLAEVVDMAPEKDALHTLCHEYLHVFAVDADWHDITDETTRSMEQATNRLATILVAAYRAKVKV